MKLIARVFDPKIRALLADFNSVRAQVALGQPEVEGLTDDLAYQWAKTNFKGLSKIFISLQEHIGQRIYDLYAI